MSEDRWSYRFDIIDTTCRVGALEFQGQRYKLPIILDPVNNEGDLRIVTLDETWKNVSLRLVEKDSPVEVPPILRQAMQEALSSMKAASLFPVVSTTSHGLIGTVNETSSNMAVHVLPHFNIVAQDPTKTVQTLFRHRIEDPLHDPVYLPGLANRGNLELMLYMGLEIFDTLTFRLDGVRGIYHTDIGPIEYDNLIKFGGVGAFCNCINCQKLFGEVKPAEKLHLIAGHNVEMLARRLNMAVTALRSGKLREVVMGKLAGNPSWTSALRSLEKKYQQDLMDNIPTFRKLQKKLVTYRDDLSDPDFKLWQFRISQEYSPISGRNTLLLLPCSARKPYSTSRTHQRIRDALSSVKGWKGRVQQVVITSPIGAVPLELEDLYPASYYDLPVTGEWFPEELETTRKVVGSIFENGDFQNVICFHKEGAEFFPEDVTLELFKGASFVNIHSEANAKGVEPIVHFSRVLSEVLGPGRGGNHEKEELLSLINFALEIDMSSLPGLEVKWSRRGRELRKGRRPLVVFKKGGPVPTTEGGAALWDLIGHEGKKVVIDDFKPKGTVFSQGVNSVNGKIRVGDIVIVGTDKEYRGVGRALVPGDLMVKGVPGPAVQMIHTVKG